MDNGKVTVSESTPSTDSIECTQTQEVDSQFPESQSQEQLPTAWGSLLPVQTLSGENIYPDAIHLSKNEYIFGRDESCDIRFTSEMFKPSLIRSNFALKHVSSKHFRIYKEKYYGPNNIEGDIVYLENEGRNKIYVNNVSLQKGEKIILLPEDTISISFKVKLFKFFSPIPYDSLFLIPELKDKFAIFKSIGSGACGDVKICFSKDGSEKFAIKIVKRAKLSFPKNKNGEKHIMNEFEICQKINHPFLLKLKECIFSPTMIYLVLELMDGGDLTERINKTNGLKESTAKLIFYQIALAVKYLHEKRITHRDLKPDNILLATNEEETIVKVGDFGLSKYVDSDVSSLKTFCGTPLYVAPEILLACKEGTYSKQVDVWSLGVILYCCLCGEPPFKVNDKTVDLQNQIVKGLYNFNPIKFKDVSLNAKDLTKQMMTVETYRRITTPKILMHPWLTDHNMRFKVKMLLELKGEKKLPESKENSENESC